MTDREQSHGGTKITDAVLAYALLRVTFGANALFHGVTRLLGDRAAFLAYVTKVMQNAPFPKALLPPFAAVLPWVEAAVGVLLVLGVFTRVGLVAGAVVMLVLQVGITLAQNWDVAGVQLIYCLVYFVLLTCLDRNRLSVDALWGT